MEIETYNSAQLSDLIRSEQFAAMPVIPISTHRAISHIHNPRAEKEDILMIIAYEGAEMVGYLGVLADRIYDAQGEGYKCGWLSCMWVNPILRGKGIAKQLLATAFKSWGDHILVTEFTPEAKGLYDRSGGFNDLTIRHGLRCYLRFNLHEILPKKNDRFKKYKTVLKLADSVANLPNELRLSFFKSNISKALAYHPVTEIDPPLDAYIRSKQLHSFERRSAPELNWITQYPWLIESAPNTESLRYHFSAVADRLDTIGIRLMHQDVIKGYIQISIRDNQMKIPYAYFEKEYTEDVMQYLYALMLHRRVNMLTVFQPVLVEHIKTYPNPFIYRRPIRRNYIISKKLDSHFADTRLLEIQDGDADCAFT